VSGVAIVTSSAADLTDELAAAHGIAVVPSIVTFGDETFRAGIDLTTDDFWARMQGPDAPVPTTAPPPPGAFVEAYEAAFAGGAEAIVSVQMGGDLSSSVNSARVAADLTPEREIHVVDTRSVSMATGILAVLAAEMAELGVSASEIARVVERRAADDVHLYAALSSDAYLRRGGRLADPKVPDQSNGSLPIITIRDGRVEVVALAHRPAEARARLLDLLTTGRVQRLAILHSPPAPVTGFRDELLDRLPRGLDPARVTSSPVGVTNGPHVGPGALGGAVLTAPV